MLPVDSLESPWSASPLLDRKCQIFATFVWQSATSFRSSRSSFSSLRLDSRIFAFISSTTSTRCQCNSDGNGTNTYQPYCAFSPLPSKDRMFLQHMQPSLPPSRHPAPHVGPPAVPGQPPSQP